MPSGFCMQFKYYDSIAVSEKYKITVTASAVCWLKLQIALMKNLFLYAKF